MMLAAASGLFLSAGVASGFAIAITRGVDWTPYKPALWLFRETADTRLAVRSAAEDELMRRWIGGRISTGYVLSKLDGFDVASDPLRLPPRLCCHVAIAQRKRGEMDDNAWNQACMKLVRIVPTYATINSQGTGVEYRIALNQFSSFVQPTRLSISILSAEVDGKQVDHSAEMGSWDNATGAVAGTVPLVTDQSRQAGKHMLKLTLRVRYDASAPMGAINAIWQARIVQTLYFDVPS